MKLFIKKHSSIIFTRADKGNITVALDKNEYITKMEDILHDQDTYINIKKKILLINSRTLHALCSQDGQETIYYNKHYITTDIYKRVFCSDGILPRAYEPKIHKSVTILESFPPLITFYLLASYLHVLFSITFQSPLVISIVSNLLRDLTDVLLIVILFWLNAVSFFTNIPIDLALESISIRWTHISSGCNSLKNKFLIAL